MKARAKTLSKMVLLATLLGTGTAFAEAAAAPQGPLYCIVQGTSKFMSALPPDGNTFDYSRKDLASAIINYEASARMQEYQLNQDLLFMGAPGSAFAIQAGTVIGGTNSAGLALGIADTSLVASLGGITTASKLNLHGKDYPVPTEQTGPVQFYQQMKDYFFKGDTTVLATVNISSIMEADNLAKNGSGVTQAQAQTLVNMIADPFPYVDPNLKEKIKANKVLDGTDMEALGGMVAAYAVKGVSVTALSDIIARRIPASGQNKSVMEVMDDHSQERFGNVQWYNSIGAASEAALLREVAHMMAYNQWVAYEQFRISEQQLALLASINSVMAKMNVGVDQMNRQLIAAQAQGKAASQELQQKLNQQNLGAPPATTP